MKRLSFIAGVLIAFGFTACQEDTSLQTDTTSLVSSSSAYDISSEAAISSSVEDLDQTTDEGMAHFFALQGPMGMPGGMGRLDCATVNRDTANNIITIDFGDGCTDRRGILRSGKIIIEYEGLHFQPGAYRKVTLEDYYIDSIKVEGVRTMTNVTDTAATDSLMVFETKLEGGKLTFTDGSFATREAEHIRTNYRGATLEDGYTTLSGSASGTLADGTGYTATILDDLVFKRSCMAHVPVQGVKEFVSGDTTITMNFGDGECDNLVDVTINGVTETIEIPGRDQLCGGLRDKARMRREERKENRNGNG